MSVDGLNLAMPEKADPERDRVAEAWAAAGGSVTNMTGGAISGGFYGVLTDGIASVSNASGATISGTKRGIFMVNGVGSVSNQGGISGGTAGVELFTGGSASNDVGGAITGVTYAIVHKSQADAAKGKEVLNFFNYAFKNGAGAATELDYVPMPDAVTKLVEAAWKSNLKDASGKAVW